MKIEHIYKKINGFEMFYRDCGSGVPVLLIHGFPLTGDMWDRQIEVLGSKTRVIVPDLRGFGRSEATDGTYLMDLFAYDLKKLLDTLGIEKAVLAGISMGGYIALAFHRMFPSCVRALVLLDTKAGADSEAGKKDRLETARRARNGEMDKIADEWAEKLFASSSIMNMPEVVRHVRDRISRTSPETIAHASLGMMERFDSTPVLKDISCPVLIIVGEKDNLIPLEESKSMAAHIKNSTVEIVEGAGHLSCLEAPAKVNSLMLKFLSDI